MLSYRKLSEGRVFVEATQPPSVIHMTSAGTVGVTLDESDLQALCRAVGFRPSPDRIEALVRDIVRLDEEGAIDLASWPIGAAFVDEHFPIRGASESVLDKLTADRAALSGGA